MEFDEFDEFSNLSKIWHQKSSASSSLSSSSAASSFSLANKNKNPFLETVDNVIEFQQDRNFFTIEQQRKDSDNDAIDSERSAVISELVNVQMTAEDYEEFQEVKAVRKEIRTCSQCRTKVPVEHAKALVPVEHAKALVEHDISDIGLKTYVLNQTFAVFEKVILLKYYFITNNILRFKFYSGGL